ncbi:MAG: S-layer homology domain-containing protein [Clostridia bacterium]|nr:S-layer homology domain-containing protein [Clostridia bacterium]
MKKLFSAILSAVMVISLFVMPVAHAEEFDGWDVSYIGDIDATIGIDTSNAYSGKASLKAVNNTGAIGNTYVMLASSFELEAGTPYVVSIKAKSRASSTIYTIFNWDSSTLKNLTQFGGTYDWTNFEWIHTPSTSGEHEMEIIIEGETQGFWFDDIVIKNHNTGEIIVNSGFEAVGEGENKAPVIEDTSVSGIYEKLIKSESYTEEDMVKVRGAFKFMPVYRAEGITVDGSPDDWEGFPSMTLPTLPTQYMVYINDKEPRDVLSEAKFAFDDENLYIYIEVTDNTFVSYQGENDYWKGDSIQLAISSTEETYGNELGFAYHPELGEGVVYGNGFVAEQKKQITLKASQSGNVTVYEAAFPWRLKFDEKPERMYFNYLCNDNDGEGRRYCAELAPKGISEFKSNKDCPLLELQDSKRQWYGWIQGERKGTQGDEITFDWYLVNTEDSEKEFTVTNTLTNQEEKVTVPAHSGIRREIKHVFEDAGTYDIAITFKADGEEMSTRTNIEVALRPMPTNEAMAIQEGMVKKTEEIKKLLDQCAKEGISTDYETINYSVMEKFCQYTLDDIALADTSRIRYTESCINDLYDEAKANLNAYLAGEKEPFEVPRFITSDITYEGVTAYADNEFEGGIERRPTFFVGYGHFNHARNDMINFPSFGANAIQQEIGPNSALHYTNGGWEVEGTGDGTPDVTSKDVKEGSLAFTMSYSLDPKPNRYTTISNSVSGLVPGKTYELKGWVKGDNVTSTFISANDYEDRVSLDGSYDWKEISTKYTVPKDRNGTVIRILTEGPTNSIMVDGLTFTDIETGENLLYNGGFEDYNTKMWTLTMFKGSAVDEYMKMLQEAEDNNVSVAVLISPQYFFDDIVNEHNIGMKAGFMNYNPNAPIAKQIIEDYVNQVVPLIAQYKSVSSICITNEPQLFVESAKDNFYIEPWREFLKERYAGDINELNRLWKTNYKSFDECDFDNYAINPVKNYDYKVFNDTTFADYHIWLADLVRKAAPGIPVNSKIMNYIGYGPRNLSNNGTNLIYMTKAFELNGCDAVNYIDDEDEILEKNIWYDYMRSYAERPLINTEDHITRDRDVDYSPAAADHMAQDIYQGAIHGRYHSDIWVWQRYTEGGSTDFIGSISYRPDAIAKIGKATLDLNRLGYYIEALQNEVPEVGIVYSDADLINNPGMAYNMYWTYDASLANGKAVRFITDLNPSAIHNYKLVVVPGTKQLSAEMLNAIADYVSNGGKVLITGNESDILTMDKRTYPHDSKIVNHIKNNAEVINFSCDENGLVNGISKAEFRKRISEELAELGINYVTLKDAKTGEQVFDVEVNIGVEEKKVVVNVVNYKETRDVNIYLGDTLVAKSVDLRTNKEYGEVVTIEKYVPVTLEITKDCVLLDSYGHWAEEFISDLYKQGVIAGRSESRYDPNATTTRWEFHALLSRAAGMTLPEYDSESDAFRPLDKITREEMCEMLVKFYEAKYGNIDGNIELSFTDKITNTEIVSKAVAAGLMQGSSDGTFGEKNTATRAESATVISNFLKGGK